jgi:hypothetical protein
MKLKYLFFLPLAVMLGAGCMKSSDQNVQATPPIGTFSGVFTRLHKKTTGTGYDTLLANVTLNLDLKTGFKLTGDTTKHAGSFGDFGYDGTYFQFTDKTVAPSNPKIHLNGYYYYGFDGTQLQLQQTFADTLGYFYVLKKI